MTRVIVSALTREVLARLAFAVGQLGFIVCALGLVWVVLFLSGVLRIV